MPKSTDKQKLCEDYLHALGEERQADMAETSEALSTLPPKNLARKGLAVLNLNLASVSTGLGGRTIMLLEPDSAINKDDDLDMGTIRIGDNVRVAVQPGGGGGGGGGKGKSADKTDNKSGDKDLKRNSIEGTVLKTTRKNVSIAVDEKYEDTCLSLHGLRLWLVYLANTVTYKRMEYALRDLQSDTSGSLLHQIVLGHQEPGTVSGTGNDEVQFFNSALNKPQKEAVEFALSQQVSVIHGPPGTGKTYTVVEIVRQLVSRGERVLVCGPSNISVDNVLERLHSSMKGDDQLIRLGHPARLLPNNLVHSLEIVSRTCDRGAIVTDIRQEIDSLLGKVSKTRSGGERRKIFADIKELRKDYRQREKDVVRDLLLGAKVVVSTLHGVGSQSIKNAQASLGGRPLFDTIIIDEVSQSLEPQCWIPLMMIPNAKRLTIAGDNKQLPPTIKIRRGKYKEMLESTLFDRLVRTHGDKIKRLLSVQYRMNTEIMEFPSTFMYGSSLVAASNVANGRLADLSGVSKSDITQSCVTWIDTQGGDFLEALEDSESSISNALSLSKWNDGEARLAAKYLRTLLNEGVKETDIGIISPYSAQISAIKNLVRDEFPGVEISTVDGFQGREKEVIIMSLVRSNDKREVGFLADDRRLNVGITRPKKHLCVIGDTETISAGSNFLKKWAEWAENNADIEYPEFSSVYEN